MKPTTRFVGVQPRDGILTQIGSSRRNRTWAAKDLLEALDAFTELTRRERHAGCPGPPALAS